ncbi:hypothetical protein BDD12DRAFT_928898 [Trichophaea hybrida]|nr:hypothetical protein BDD12DRAFT_928898 [Trichophaea hybrida]
MFLTVRELLVFAAWSTVLARCFNFGHTIHRLLYLCGTDRASRNTAKTSETGSAIECAGSKEGIPYFTGRSHPPDVSRGLSNRHEPAIRSPTEDILAVQQTPKGCILHSPRQRSKNRIPSVIIKKFCNNERRFLERELQGYAALRYLQGHGIPQVIGHYRCAECDDPDIDDTSPYLLVLMYIALFPLSQLPDPERDETFLDKRTIDALHEIVDQILDAGVLHNDMQNSENMLVDMHQPDKVLVSIVDFGQATVVEAVEEVQRQHQRTYLDSAWEAYLDRCWDVWPDAEG